MTEKKSHIALRVILAFFALVYALILLKMTFLKDGVRMSADEYRFIPFNGIYEYKAGVKSAASLFMNYGGNLLLFLPAGLLLPAIFKKLSLAKTVAVCFFLSLCIEVLQYATASGYADIDDVIMNPAGAAVGAFIYFYILGGKKKSLGSYIATVIAAALMTLGFVGGAWYFAPNILPDKAAVVGGMVAGRSIDEYNVRVRAYKMSHGDVFAVAGTAEGSDGKALEKTEPAYRLADTAVFIIRDNGSCRVVGIEEMIKAVGESDNPYVRLWKDKDGRYRIVMLEKD